MVELLALVANAILWIVPLWYLMPRAGMNRNWALLAVFPIVGTVLLWIVALKRWPGDEVRA